MVTSTAEADAGDAKRRRQFVEERLRLPARLRLARRGLPPEGRLGSDEQPMRALRSTLVDLGPVFVSFGRYLSSRIDLLTRRDCGPARRSGRDRRRRTRPGCAFEQDGRLVVDIVEYERPLYGEYQVVPNLFSNVSDSRPVRMTIDLAEPRIVERQDVDFHCAPDFPAHQTALTGFAYESMWMLAISVAGRPGRKFFDQLVRVDWSTGSTDVYQAPPGRYLGGEPAFVPESPSSRTGAVICQAFDAERTRSSFLVFDGQSISRGPVATIAVPSPMPLLFHSVFMAR